MTALEQRPAPAAPARALPAADGSAATVRRVLLAVAVAVAPLLQVTGFLLHPPVPEDPAALLAVVATDPRLWFVTHLAAAAAAALFGIAGLPLAGLARERGAGLATAGALLMALGGLALTVAFGAEAHLYSLAVDPALDRDAMAALVALDGASPTTLLLGAGMPLSGIGQLLLAVGLLRSRAVPRWAPALVLVGVLASIAGAPGSALGPVLLTPAIVGYAALAREVSRRR